MDDIATIYCYKLDMEKLLGEIIKPNYVLFSDVKNEFLKK